MRHRTGVLILALALVAAACSSQPGTVVVDDGTDGFQRVENPAKAFSMLVPEGWTVVDASEFDTTDLVDQAISSMPELGGMREDLMAAAANGVVFFAFDFEGSQPGFIDNINVIKAPRGSASPEALRRLNADQIAAMFGGSPDSRVDTTLQGYDVVWLDYSVPSFGLQAKGALVLTEESQWVITLAASSATRLDFDFETMVDFFRET